MQGQVDSGTDALGTPGAADRRLSPYTGWTRGHWTAVLDATLAAVRPHATPGHALIHLPGPTGSAGRHSDGLEGFARTFLGAGFRLAQDGPGALAEWYATGLATGTDPHSPERWPRVTEVAQAKVEAAAIALALHESRAVLWDALDDPVRERIVGWLAEVVGQPYPACNWIWFQAVVEAFLRSVGGPWSAEDLERTVARTEEWYLGDGWYTDGLAGTAARNIDWYAGWAMNFYPLWYCRMSEGDADPQLTDRYRDRLGRYLQTTQHLFAPDGPPLHQGRSLTYRYAALAPLWAGAVFDATLLAPGRIRRLASGTLRHFLDRSRAGGPQPIGWYGPFEPIRQPYSGAGSPYWSSKAFAGLVLPADHPVWTDVEEPLSVEERDVALTLRRPGWLVSGTRADGVVRVVNHGTDHAADEPPAPDDPGYSRWAYATHAGPQYDPSAWYSPVDGQVTLVDEEGAASHRRPLVPLGVAGRVAASRHRAHWPLPSGYRLGPWVRTASVLRGALEVRLVSVDPADELTTAAGPWTLRVGGYPVTGDAPPRGRVRPGEARAAGAGGLTSAVVGLLGMDAAGVLHAEGGNAFGRFAAIPYVHTGGPVAFAVVYAAAVVLTGAPTPTELPAVVAEPDLIRVVWPDGAVDEVRLAG